MLQRVKAGLRSAGQSVRQWYMGTTEVPENDPASPAVIIGVWTRYHWTARAVRALVAFYLRHWKWLWGTAITITLGLVALSRAV